MSSRGTAFLETTVSPSEGERPTRSLRSWLEHLSASGRLATIENPVALEHELAAIAKKLDGSRAAVFVQPGGHAIPVVSGFMSRRAWIAEAMGVSEDQLLHRFREAAEHPLA